MRVRYQLGGPLPDGRGSETGGADMGAVGGGAAC